MTMLFMKIMNNNNNGMMVVMMKMMIIMMTKMMMMMMYQGEITVNDQINASYLIKHPLYAVEIILTQLLY